MLQQLSFVGVHINLFYWPSQVLGFSKKRGVSAHEISDFFVDEKIHGNFATSIFWADSMTSSLWIFWGDLMFFLSTKVWGEHFWWANLSSTGRCRVFQWCRLGQSQRWHLELRSFDPHWPCEGRWWDFSSFVKEMGEVEDWRVDKFNVCLSI